MAMNDREFWRVTLAPPPGGFARLVTAVEARRRPRSHRLPAFAYAAIFAVAICGLFAVDYMHGAQQRAVAAAIEAALRPPDLTAPVVTGGAALELPSSRADVRIFAIATLSAGDATR
jgi:hypothetical protein